LAVTKKPPRKVKDSATQPRPKRQKIHPVQPADQAERPLSLVEILQQSMAPTDTSTVNHESNANLSPSPPPPPPLWQNPPSAPVTMSSSTLSGSYPPLASRPTFNPAYQQPQPPDVGRFSKLAVPCFKCKAAHTQLTFGKSVMVCNLSVTPASYEELSATIPQSSDLTRHLFQIRAGYKLTGVSAAITGAIAMSGNSSSTSSVASPTCDYDYSTDTSISESDKKEVYALIHSQDRLTISLGNTASCDTASFGAEERLFYNACYAYPQVISARARHIRDKRIRKLGDTCVLAAFEGSECTEDGTIIAEIEQVEDISDPEDNTALCVYDGNLVDDEGDNFGALKWVCGPGIDKDWQNPLGIDITYRDPDSDFDNDTQSIFARSVDAELSRDHVTVAPADGPNCNSAQHRDTDTKVQGHCHSFNKPFSSLSATIKRAGHSKVGGSEPCSVLVFSDDKCKKDGAEIVDLNNTAALGVCHNVTLHHGNDLVTPIAGHSWKWVCGRQKINECINGAIDSGSDTDTDTDDETTTTVKKGKTFTVTATTSLACSLTTEAAHSVDVVTSVITQKPVTHTITSVFTKTQLRVRTKLITSVATAVSTVHHTLTKPFSTTYKVCDAEASRQS
ncbi:hypothetical protein KCU94_g10388, partial [Aureobasidium melanogenum]